MLQACRHLEQDPAKRPHITLFAKLIVLVHLRRHKPRCACRPAVLSSATAQSMSQPQVSNAKVAVARNKNISGLKVAVDNVVTVEGFDALDKFEESSETMILAKTTLRDSIVKLTIFAIFDLQAVETSVKQPPFVLHMEERAFDAQNRVADSNVRSRPQEKLRLKHCFVFWNPEHSKMRNRNHLQYSLLLQRLVFPPALHQPRCPIGARTECFLHD
mmetsp:Transcript_34721/g.79205  ORF Transcript_34721/g.79205 Transcript_34721/m.79205 type:complete len:216 (+) Transcript_34721:456-1103(+)